ncbi:DnaJ domain-containing protein [Lipomyces japonicus]|uniref:DnaJ domain-containing protein n=1 Tax=Lipomyces japonicus TaxID=56871 RepID=UPI0034CDD195
MVLVDYYNVLGCDPSASQAQIRDAYKRAALATHPDRFSPSSPEAKTATQKFQAVSDAYYVLGDSQRRASYDHDRSTQPSSSFFTGATFTGDENDDARDRAYQKEFMDAFEEMFADAKFDADDLRHQAESEPHGGHVVAGNKFYTVLGGLGGGALGFIFANLPGAIAGLAAGAKLGNIRDHRGKSVYSVYQELPQQDRAKVLAELAQRIFTSVPLP